MTPETILYCILAGIFSLGVSVFMYGYKSKHNTQLRWLFGTLRFITLFSILLLLINPKFTSETYTIEKPKLPVLVDNSASVVALDQSDNVRSFVRSLRSNDALNDAFELSFYGFGNDFGVLDTLGFSEKNTNIAKALQATNELYNDLVAPTILITDGNQTLGRDYEFVGDLKESPIYPLILGDSIKYTDLKIERLNTNRYTFLKNQFPVEAILVYNGTGTVNSQFVITQGTATVFRQNVSFSEENNTQTIAITLPASAVGLQKYTAQLLPLEEEKNKVNNRKRFAVEVIDQATNVLLVSKIIHPDLGAIKKSVTSNEQRQLTIATPAEATSLLNEYQLVILYQPDRSFAPVYQAIDNLKKNTLVISGLETDWNFLNSAQEAFNKEVTNQTEDASAVLNLNYGTFAVQDIGFDDFPPLKTLFGGLEVTIPHETLLHQSIDGFDSGSPLLATMELNGKRDAILDGEGLWKWRAQSYIATNDFESFDTFMGKLVQYLASNKRRSRLEVNNETFYYNNNPIEITAQYFDKNFVFDPRASLQITVINTETNERTVFPMLLKQNFYEVPLNSVPAGEYRYTVSVADEAIARSGNFTILDFDVEQQFLNADVAKLQRLAVASEGASFFASETEQLVNTLLNDDRYQPVQKSQQKVVPLIDWKYLLALIVLTLSAEWFIRKYNGLI
ncbi:MAG: VWA domain-containing protein [Flavobacteriales bacterium]|jgi:hypothetical protein|nr:VWA domain-containing protein [Flavobacteriales bacterium]